MILLNPDDFPQAPPPNAVSGWLYAVSACAFWGHTYTAGIKK